MIKLKDSTLEKLSKAKNMTDQDFDAVYTSLYLEDENLLAMPNKDVWSQVDDYEKQKKVKSLTPEHEKRGSIDHASEGALHPDIVAAYDYVDSVSHTKSYPETHSWSGWALREAFLAGVSYAESKA